MAIRRQLLVVAFMCAARGVIAAPCTPCDETAAQPAEAAYVGLPQELGVLLKNERQAIPVSNANVDRMGLRQAAAVAQAARCSSVNRKAWQCGEACTSLPDLKLAWTYGDNRDIPYIFVAHSAGMKAVIVTHAGSNFKALDSWLTDFNSDREEAGKELHNTGGERAIVHEGFYNLWKKSNTRILPQVKRTLEQTGYTKVICIGHSLGGALAEMDAVFLRNRLSKRIKVQYVGFGVPRVGNERWAEVVEKKLGRSQVHVTNADDIVPHTPPSKFGFSQTTNEIWINPDTRKAVLCRGRENERCAAGVSTSDLGWGAHGGPYFGVEMESKLCR